MTAALLSGLTTDAAAFPIPERLEYELSYTGIPAGHAVQEVRQVGTDIHIVSTARSAKWLQFFFPVDDRIESFLESGSPPLHIGTPRLYQERKHEGRTITNREARFDSQKLEVTTVDHRNKTEKKHAITKRTYDTLSSFYYFRTVPLQVGASHFIDIYDCKRLWNTEVKCCGGKRSSPPWGDSKPS